MPKGIWENRGKKCKCGGKPFSRINRQGEMFCVKCYRRIKKYGYFKRVIADLNEMVLLNNFCLICLYDRNGRKKAETKIDKEDYEKVKDKKWGLDGRGYVNTKSIGKCVKLHQFLIGKIEKKVIDHINGDKLDNRKNNLRHITSQQNMWNNKKAKGYYFEKRRNKYIVRIKKNGITYGGKGFETEIEAKYEAKKLRKKYFGEYRKENMGI